MATFSDNGFEQEHLSFGQLPRKVGIYTLPKPSEGNRFSAHVLFSFIEEGDAQTDLYFPDEVLHNWISIDAYDQSTEQIEGRFDVTLVPESRSTPGAPDTLKIEQGRFRTVIVKQVR